jgi:hypothetical protein
MTPLFVDGSEADNWTTVSVQGKSPEWCLSIIEVCKQEHIPGRFCWRFSAKPDGIGGTIDCELAEAAIMVTLLT